MLQKIALFILFFVIFFPHQASYAISESEYESLLKNSSILREADNNLNDYWKEVWNSLEGDYKRQVLADQRLWVKTGRDEAAEKYIAQGMDKASAYAKSIQERINQLRVIKENNALSEEEAGSAKADDFYNSDEVTKTEKQGSLSDQENENKQLSGSSPMPSINQRTDHLMEQNIETQKQLLYCREIVANTTAKVQKPLGNAYPLLPVLSRSLEEYAQFDRKLTQAMLNKSGGARIDDPKQLLDIMNSAWDTLGYSMEATCSQLFKDISPRQYFYLTGQHVMDICIPIVQFFFKGEKSLKDALANGYISREAALGYIDASLRYYKAMEKVNNVGMRLPN